MPRRREKLAQKILQIAAGVTVSPNEHQEQKRRDADNAIRAAQSVYDPAGVTNGLGINQDSRESPEFKSGRDQVYPGQPGQADMKALPNLLSSRKPVSEGRNFLKRKKKIQEIRGSDGSSPTIEGPLPAEFDPTTLPEVTHVAEPFSLPFQGASAQKTENEKPSTESRARHSEDNQRSRESQELRESLDRMYSLLRDAKTRSPSIDFEQDIIHPCTLKAVEMALRDILRSYRSIYTKLDAAEATAENIEMKCQSLQIMHNDSTQNNKELTERISTLQAEYAEKENKNMTKIGHLGGRLEVLTDQYNAQEGKHDARVRKIQEDYQSEKDTLVNEYRLRIERLEGQIAKERHAYKDETHRLKEQHSQQLASKEWSAGQLLDETKRDAKDELARMKRAAGDKLAEMTRDLESQLFHAQEFLKVTTESHEVRIENMRTQHNSEKQEVVKRFNADKTQMVTAHQEEMASLEGLRQLDRDEYKFQLETKNREIRTLEENKSLEIQALKDRYEDEMSKERSNTRARHELDTRGIRETMESLKEALVNRDNFKAMSDHELKYRFQDISVEVDEFARVEWDKRQELSWPFPSQSLQKSGNERRTKKCLIQNTLWVILYKRIFYTPFRVLGTEGLSLENEWRGIYGEGKLICPNAGQFTESKKIQILPENSLTVHDRLKIQRNGGTKP